MLAVIDVRDDVATKQEDDIVGAAVDRACIGDDPVRTAASFERAADRARGTASVAMKPHSPHGPSP